MAYFLDTVDPQRRLAAYQTQLHAVGCIKIERLIQLRVRCPLAARVMAQFPLVAA